MSNAIYGQKSTFSSDLDQSIYLEDNIKNYGEKVLPLIKRWNGKAFEKAVDKPKYGWFEKEARKQSCLIEFDMTDNAASFVAVELGIFNKDDVVKIDNEYMHVRSVQGNQINVTRAFAGTTAAAHTQGRRAVRIGIAAAEGALADKMVINTPYSLWNATQIFEDVVELTGTQNEALIRGDEKAAKLLSIKEKEIWKVIQKSLLFGKRSWSPNNKLRTLGGVEFFLETYAPNNIVGGAGTDFTSAAEVYSVIENAIERIADNCGENLTLYTDYTGVRRLSMLEFDKLQRPNQRSEKQRGIGAVTSYLSQIGVLDVVLVPDQDKLINGNIYLLDDDKIGYKAFKNRGMKARQLHYAGDGYLWQVLGEYTFKMSNPKVAAKIDFAKRP